MPETKKLTQLPIDAHLERILQAFKANANLVLTASPGSGKTTRIPPNLISLLPANKNIVVLVPKRIAAISAASRIAEENNWELGKEVGYQVRFDNKTSAATRLIFMTEGVFIKRLNDESFLAQLQTIVFDEFHERSSHIDLSLGICLEKQIEGFDLKLVVMSATLNAEKILNFLPDAEWVEIDDKPYPLHIVKSKKSQRLSCDKVFVEVLIDSLQQALNLAKRDTLIFLPGLYEIRYVERALLEKFKNFEINILHGSIKLEEQRRILQPSAGRRIILSTNIAESSITIPSVDLVIDSGLEKKSVTEKKIGFKRLELTRISHFSANQRAGRAARTGEGYCYQLWHELDERSMPKQIEPEILQSDLLEETLTLLSLGIKQPDQFSWLDKPKKSFQDSLSQLKKWGLVDSSLNITAKGKSVQSCPLDIERSVLFVELIETGYTKEASRLLAYIETTTFDKIHEAIAIDNLQLNDLGRRIEIQLYQFSANRPLIKPTNSFRESLIKIFFKDFPNKIAKRKDKAAAVSSLGRGLEMASYLQQKDYDYYLLLSGRELSSALTFCDFAVGFSNEEFASISQSEVTLDTEVHFDIEKRRLYKIEKKKAGYFEISASTKTFVNEKAEPEIFLSFLKTNFSELIVEHPDYKNYVTKINFLRNKSDLLDIKNQDFDYLGKFEEQVLESVIETIKSVEEFFSFRLWDLLAFFTPQNITVFVQELADSFKLPSGKTVSIDYESEQAPKISARLQEFFGLKHNPLVCQGKIRMTLELLAPNYRPTQVTSQLENFWKVSYHEIKKELKARYPRHAWPDDPINYVHEKKKT